MSGTTTGIDQPRTIIDGIEHENGNDLGRSAEPEVRNPEPQRTGEDIGGFDVYSPADATSTAGNTPKRRGRPPGSRNRNATSGEPAGIDTGRENRAKTPGDITDLTKVLLSLHDMLAAVCAAEYVEITKEQAAKLSNGIKEVGKHYSFNMTAKQVAIADLVMIVLAIYGPMFVIMFKGIAAPKKKGPLLQMPNPTRPADAPPVAQPQAAAQPPASGTPKRAMNPSEVWAETPSLDITAI